MTVHQSTGLSVSYSDPLLKSPRSGFLGRLTDEISGLDFEKAAFGGWVSLRLELAANLVDVNAWVERGIGRHIEVHNPYLDLIFEGFVNTINPSAGTVSTVVGPLVDIGNRVSVMYAPILDDTVSPPIVGSRTPTTIAQNTGSQGLYGIWEKELSGGTCIQGDAERYRDTFLANRARPPTTQTLNIGGGGGVSLSLEVLGYKEFLNAYIYADATTGTRTISTKLTDVLAYDPNNVFSADYSQIETNAYLTSREEEDSAFAMSVIKSLVALGDVNDDPYTFGVVGSRVVTYRNANALATRYEHRITSPDLRVQTYGLGGDVDPWDVEAGEWLYVPDWLVGTSPPVDRNDDPRYIFIETMRFTAPDSLSINGTTLENLPQLLAKQGMGGMT
jgi:hypothetical protein